MPDSECIRHKSCLWGFLGIALVGTLLHNAYVLTRPYVFFALIAPVNESVWEHLKMAYWGVLIWTMIEGLTVRKNMKNPFPALAVGIAVFILTIVVVFYSYTAFTHTSVLWVDISTFVAGAWLSRWFICRIWKSPEMKKPAQRIALVFLLTLALVFMMFTFYPPESDIFIDHSESRFKSIHSFF
jgi:hypothetical protein